MADPPQEECRKNSRVPLQRTAALLLIVQFSACDRADHQASQSDPYQVSDSSHDPGNPVPTNDRSMELIGKDPEFRRLAVRQLMDDGRKQCNIVTQAVLKAGFEGTDVWRVTCADTHDWLMTFRPDEPPMIESCSGSINNCRAPWSQPRP